MTDADCLEIVAAFACFYPTRFGDAAQRLWEAKIHGLAVHYDAPTMRRAADQMTDEVEPRDVSWATYKRFVRRVAGVRPESERALLGEGRPAGRRSRAEHERGMAALGGILESLGIS